MFNYDKLTKKQKKIYRKQVQRKLYLLLRGNI